MVPEEAIAGDGEGRPLWTRRRHARLLAEGQLAQVDRFGDPVLYPALPLAVYPGRKAKIEELRRRADRGEERCRHPDAELCGHELSVRNRRASRTPPAGTPKPRSGAQNRNRRDIPRVKVAASVSDRPRPRTPAGHVAG